MASGIYNLKFYKNFSKSKKIYKKISKMENKKCNEIVTG